MMSKASGILTSLNMMPFVSWRAASRLLDHEAKLRAILPTHGTEDTNSEHDTVTDLQEFVMDDITCKWNHTDWFESPGHEAVLAQQKPVSIARLLYCCLEAAQKPKSAPVMS